MESTREQSRIKFTFVINWSFSDDAQKQENVLKVQQKLKKHGKHEPKWIILEYSYIHFNRFCPTSYIYIYVKLAMFLNKFWKSIFKGIGVGQSSSQQCLLVFFIPRGTAICLCVLITLMTYNVCNISTSTNLDQKQHVRQVSWYIAYSEWHSTKTFTGEQ